MRTNRTWLFLFLLTGSWSVMAGTQTEPLSDSSASLPQFEFRFAQKQWSQKADKRELITPDFKSLNDTATQVEQFDARILYPLTSKGLEVGLGLNIRYIQGISNTTVNGAQQKTHLESTIPALHARALFDLPFQGFSAGLEGSHTGFSDQLFDYRAQLRYEWTNGLGLQGGWQHQQMSLDLSEDTDTTFASEGPYLDLNWRF
jgi:hypothetical protein